VAAPVARQIGNQLVQAASLPKIKLHDVRHSYGTAGRDAEIDWKALSNRIGDPEAAFTCCMPLALAEIL
jgi:hypothetical protein